MLVRKVLITGGTGGIGSSIVERFKDKGHNVFAPTHQQLDLSLPIDLQLTDWNYDVVINCACINDVMNLREASMFDFFNIKNTIHIDFYAPYQIIQMVLPYMVKNSYGRIINIGSIWQEFTKEGRSSYSIAKSALHALTKSVAVEYGKNGILCNTISPGFIDTNLTKKNNTEEQIESLLESIPLGRLGEPEEIANLVYQMTEQNTFITGQNIIIDGGYSCLG